MNDSLYIVVVIGLAATAVALHIVAGRLDRSRIREEVARSGGEVLDIIESPFGRGWFGADGNRLYKVTYHTQSGRTLTATCKTSLFTGVFWSSDGPPTGFAARPNSDSSPYRPQAQASVCGNCGINLRPGRTDCHWCGRKPELSADRTSSDHSD